METLSIVVMNWRDRCNPAAGGAEVYVHEAAKRWARWGHDVTLLTSRFPGSPEGETLDGVAVLRQGTRYTVYRRVRQTYLESYRGRADAVLDAINTIPFFTPRYVDGSTRLVSLIFQLAREGWFYEMPYPVALVGRYLLEDRWLALYADLPTIAISESTRNDLQALGFRRVAVVPPGMSSPPPGNEPFEKEARPTLLFLGRLKRYKLPHEAIAAFKLIRAEIPEAQLWIVGDGYMRDRLERQAPPGVTFFGHVGDIQKSALIRRAHVLLFPSVREGWGLGVTEANALGVPAIGYDVPGLRDSIHDGMTGCLVPPHDVRAMADAALGLLKDPARLHRMAGAAVTWANTLDWDTTAKSMLGILASGVGSTVESV